MTQLEAAHEGKITPEMEQAIVRAVRAAREVDKPKAGK